MTRSRWTGLAVAGAYLVVAAVSFGSGLLPVRPLYDGAAPPSPYQWVSPPSDLAATNVPPQPTTETTLKFTKKGRLAGGQIFTGEAPPQAALALGEDVFRAPKGQTGVRLVITPRDPATFGEPPQGIDPNGATFEQDFDGNAYEFTATYEPSGRPADLSGPATLVLRYAFGASGVVRFGDQGWERIEATPSHASLQIFGDIDRLGVYAPVAAAAIRPPEPGIRGDLIAAAAGVAVALGGIAIARRNRRIPAKPSPKKSRR